jgi:hypothetical protein
MTSVVTLSSVLSAGTVKWYSQPLISRELLLHEASRRRGLQLNISKSSVPINEMKAHIKVGFESMRGASAGKKGIDIALDHFVSRATVG